MHGASGLRGDSTRAALRLTKTGLKRGVFLFCLQHRNDASWRRPESQGRVVGPLCQPEALTWLGSFLAAASTTCAESLSPANACVAATLPGAICSSDAHAFVYSRVAWSGRRLRDLAAAGSTIFGFKEDCYLTRQAQERFFTTGVSFRNPCFTKLQNGYNRCFLLPN